MMEVNIKPDVVSCTALISALGSDAQWERAERVIVWMHQVGHMIRYLMVTLLPLSLYGAHAGTADQIAQ